MSGGKDGTYAGRGLDFPHRKYQRVVSAVAALTMGQTDGRTDGETPGRCCEREAGVTLAYSCLTNHSEAAAL